MGGDLYFSLDLSRIGAKLTRSEQKTSNSHWICAKLTRSEQKKNQIVAGFAPTSRDLSKKFGTNMSKTHEI